ncbi:MAG: Sua5/YciO/YrdC/YwlC family protein [Roseateles sp.]|uniref:Sua5/YciO/YrdC/YwlC family protein n=1 Tax=Roseateles sp. TaxID=1971397 RepID=UPI0040357F95
MPRMLRHEVHPANPQGRLLHGIATQVRAGAIAVLPTAAGYALACRLDHKTATDQLGRRANRTGRAPAALLYRDLAQAASYLQIGDEAFRAIRAADAGVQAFVLRSTRRVPRRLLPAAGGASLLCFAGHVAAQGLLALLDEPLFIALPAAVATAIDALPAGWLGGVDVALDAGALPAARAVRVVDLHGLLQLRPSLSRWLACEPALA